MKKRKINRIYAFLAVVFSCLTCMSMASCGGKKTSIPTLHGFDIVETMQVEYGMEAHAQSPLFVTDDEGLIYEVSVTVLDSTGTKIQTDEGETFYAKDINGYTIVYNITTFDFSIEKKTTVDVIVSE